MTMKITLASDTSKTNYLLSYVALKKHQHAFLTLSKKKGNKQFHIIYAVGINQLNGRWHRSNFVNTFRTLQAGTGKDKITLSDSAEVFATHFPISDAQAKKSFYIMAGEDKTGKKDYYIFKRNCHNYVVILLARMGIVADFLLDAHIPVRKNAYRLERKHLKYFQSSDYEFGGSKFNFYPVMSNSMLVWPEKIIISKELKYTPPARYFDITEKINPSNFHNARTFALGSEKLRFAKAKALLKDYLSTPVFHKSGHFVKEIKEALKHDYSSGSFRTENLVEFIWEKIFERDFHVSFGGRIFKRLAFIKLLLCKQVPPTSYHLEIDKRVERELYRLGGSFHSSDKIEKYYESYLLDFDCRKKEKIFFEAAKTKRGFKAPKVTYKPLLG
ncbi:hypothetical protein P0136_01620 [Lentisphaerota bacterium ZTH]|nr:hypothetical protein JYG24_07240 [Lentisphaerota bacterium]WET06711.1 hypothetical protein P0136_01620 [Lentisphaerota bacterium ZTH]